MLIAIPSKGRPFKSKSKELISSAKIFVPESEFDLYNKIYPNDIISVPNEVKGITKTRNWILKNNLGVNVVFVDDDLKKCGYWITQYEKRKFKDIKNEQMIINEFKKLFEVCNDLDYKIWGLKTESSKISQHDEKPFVFMTYITASCMGIVNDGSYYFNENYEVKEDYEIGLRHIKEKGGVLGARHFSWENEHWDTNGGCGDYRTDQIERKCINQLIKEYPKYVKSVNRKNSAYCIKLHF
jgi:hypothetical protein